MWEKPNEESKHCEESIILQLKRWNLSNVVFFHFLIIFPLNFNFHSLLKYVNARNLSSLIFIYRHWTENMESFRNTYFAFSDKKKKWKIEYLNAYNMPRTVVAESNHLPYQLCTAFWRCGTLKQSNASDWVIRTRWIEGFNNNSNVCSDWYDVHQ